MLLNGSDRFAIFNRERGNPLSDLQPNSFAFFKFGEGILKLDCKLFPVLRQFQERHFQLWSAGGYGQFGAPRRAPTAFFGIAWHGGSPRQLAGSATGLSATGA